MNPLKNKVAPPASNATLDDWLAYIEAMHPVEIDLGLDRVLIVLRKLFPSRPAARIVTVAGTNGKGSTIACLEALLGGSLRRGLCLSPRRLTGYLTGLCGVYVAKRQAP